MPDVAVTVESFFRRLRPQVSAGWIVVDRACRLSPAEKWKNLDPEVETAHLNDGHRESRH